MSVIIITGSAGLIGSAASYFFLEQGYDVVGIDNNMREVFFGPDGNTQTSSQSLVDFSQQYQHESVDIRDQDGIKQIFAKYGSNTVGIIHTAGQPSHDWAARDPELDFTVNANGTLNLLQQTRAYCPDAAFICFSTNKVYGDTPNYLPLVEHELRWELDESHPYYEFGIDESMSIDQCTHSLFGVSKAAADLLTQEYGKYFGLKTMCLRGGCLTGSNHSAVKLHGFLNYLVKCAITDTPYTVYGYEGKQVRDNIHAQDVATLLGEMVKQPRSGEVYNIGGSRHSNCSMLEAIKLCESYTGRQMNWQYADNNRIGDHIWWVSDVRKLQQHFPSWKYQYDINAIIDEIFANHKQKEAMSV